MDIEKLKRCK